MRIQAVLLALLLLSCGRRTETEFGLRKIEIRLPNDELAALMHGGKEKNAVPATLWMEGVPVRGELSLSGSGSLDAGKKSFRFDRAESVPSGIRIPIEFPSIKIAAQVQDPSMLRTLVGSRILSFLGFPTPIIEPVVLSLNGSKPGLYLMTERITEDFFDRRQIKVERVYKHKLRRATFGPDMIVDPERGFESNQGEFHGPEISRIAQWANHPVSEDGFRLGQRALDLEDAVRYFAGVIFLGNCDGLTNNMYIYKLRGEVPLRFSPWDWERSHDGSCPVETMMKEGHLIPTLLSYPDLYRQFQSEIGRLASEFTPEKFAGIASEEWARIQEAYRADRYLGPIRGGAAYRQLLDQQRLWIEALKATILSAPAGG